MGLPNKVNFNDESKKINTLLSGKAKTTNAASKANLHTSNLLPPKFLYKSFYDICPQTSFLVTFCILCKKYTPLSFSLSVLPSKKIRALEISIKLSSLTGMDGSLFRKTFIQYVKMWLTSRGGLGFIFDILQKHKKPERRAPG